MSKLETNYLVHTDGLLLCIQIIEGAVEIQMPLHPNHPQKAIAMLVPGKRNGVQVSNLPRNWSF